MINMVSESVRSTMVGLSQWVRKILWWGAHDKGQDDDNGSNKMTCTVMTLKVILEIFIKLQFYPLPIVSLSHIWPVHEVGFSNWLKSYTFWKFWVLGGSKLLKVSFCNNWSLKSRNEILSVPSALKWGIWSMSVVIFYFGVISWIWGLEVEFKVNLNFELTLVNIQCSDIRIIVSTISFHLEYNFRPRCSHGWIFIGLEGSLVFFFLALT